MHMAKIVLEFSSKKNLTLSTVSFSHNLLQEEHLSFRGKGVNILQGNHSFQWTPAVRAMSLLFLWTKGQYVNPFLRSPLYLSTLSGGKGSFAASLDYALSKKPSWLLDMFGLDAQGDSIAPRLFIRGNPERKRGGGVIVAINPIHLSADNIEIFCNGREVSKTESELLGHVMAQKRNFSSLPKSLVA